MSKASIEFALQTNRNRSSQEIKHETKFFDTMFKVIGEIVPTNILEKTDNPDPTIANFDNFSNEYRLDTTRKIIHTDIEAFGYRFTVTTPLTLQELATVLQKHSIATVSKEDCPNDIPPCTVRLARVN